MQRRKTCTIVIQLDQEEGRTNVAFFNPFVGSLRAIRRKRTATAGR